MSAKYLSVFLKMNMPNSINTIVPAKEIPMRSQFIGAVPKIAALAPWITPVIGFKASTQEYLPAILAG